MPVRLCIGDAPILEPGIQLGKGLELRPRHKEPPPEHAHLVLDLPLLPTRGRGTGDRLDQIVPAHLFEPAIVGADLADEDRVHRRVHVVVDAPRTGAAEEGECPIVGVKHHLLRLAWVSPNERHPAVAEADMGDLDRHGHAVEDHDLMAPGELVGLAGIKAQRNIGAGRRFLRRLRPTGRIPPDSIIAAAIAAVAQLFVNPDDGQPLPLRPPGILGQHLVQLGTPRIDLWAGLCRLDRT